MYWVGLWNNIKRRLEKFSCHTRFEVGDSSKVRFWHDLWCGEWPLRKPSQFYLVLLAQIMLLLRSYFTFGVRRSLQTDIQSITWNLREDPFSQT